MLSGVASQKSASNARPTLCITLNRQRTYYFRIIVVPLRLRAAFDLQRKIRRSLKTDSLRLELRYIHQYAARFEAVFDNLLVVAEQDD
ncbi:DUF6538 domain-containing protein [Pseudomonas cerasi]|uniref:DUF6538 domain-containing protein n=1 Tax=Pseudomonas cerasi TaxID=1583341 RepID=UPI0030B881C1